MCQQPTWELQLASRTTAYLSIVDARPPPHSSVPVRAGCPQEPFKTLPGDRSWGTAPAPLRIFNGAVGIDSWASRPALCGFGSQQGHHVRRDYQIAAQDERPADGH